MACQHPASHADWCFQCWSAARHERYEALRVELVRLISAQVPILETWTNGRMTAWEWVNTGDPTTCRIMAENLTDGAENLHDAFIPGLTPAYLANHLLTRSQGFGCTLQAFCCTCGDATVDIPCEADPTCPTCAVKLAAFAEMGEPDDAADVAERMEGRR